MAKLKKSQNRKGCHPPPNFRPAEGIVSACFSNYAPPFIRPVVRRGRRAEGMRYERKAQAYLDEAAKGKYIPSPWLRFANKPTRGVAKTVQWCQPDGIIIDLFAGLITIVEIKLQHTSNAWFQTRQLYEPVLQAIFPRWLWSYSVIEVVCWMDPDVAFPERFSFIPDILEARAGGFHVHLWNPRHR
jgi:hypothetical protein